MGFQISRLITYHAISRAVALVESITGKLFEQIEDGVCFLLWNFVCPRAAFDEILSLLRHLLLVLLTHGAPEKISLAEAVTGKLLQQKGLRLRYFRHPYLHTGRDLATQQAVERFLTERGYRVAPVTVDNEDYLFAAAYSKATERGDERERQRLGAAYIRYTEQAVEYSERLSSTLFGRGIKQVVLLHANALNAAYFDELARMMKKRGYAFISLDEALRDEAYDSADTYTGAESLNWLARWAVTKGVKNTENALDDCPEVPEFVVKAADGAP